MLLGAAETTLLGLIPSRPNSELRNCESSEIVWVVSLGSKSLEGVMLPWDLTYGKRRWCLLAAQANKEYKMSKRREIEKTKKRTPLRDLIAWPGSSRPTSLPFARCWLCSFAKNGIRIAYSKTSCQESWKHMLPIFGTKNRSKARILLFFSI